MKRIWITGTSGFLGSRLKEYYQEEYNIIEASHRVLDYTKYEEVKKFMEDNKPQILIHCGAISNTATCEQDPCGTYKVNVEIPAILALACREFQCKFIFCSSDQIYFGTSSKSKHGENTWVSPVNAYGQQKLEAERRCQEVNEETVSLRLSWMYDYKTIAEGEHSDLYRSLKNAITKKAPISYPNHDFRGITYVKEVVQQMEKVFSIPGGIYNYGAWNQKNKESTGENSQLLSTYDIVKQVLIQMEGELSSLSPNEQAFSKQPRNLCMDLDKIKSYGIEFSSTVDGFLKCRDDERVHGAC